MSRPDAELVSAALQGDLAAFRQLYERHYALAVGLARSHVADGHLAEDAAQEAFAIAAQRLATLSRPERFAAWLGTIVRRTAIKLSRSRKHHRELPVETAAADSRNNHPIDDSRKQAVHAAVNRLPAPLREVVWLHYFSDLSHVAIARSLGISEAAVHGRLQRARQRLQQELSSFPVEELHDD